MRRCLTFICCLAITGCGTLPSRPLMRLSAAPADRRASVAPGRSSDAPDRTSTGADPSSSIAIAAQSPAGVPSHAAADSDTAEDEFERLLAEELARSSPEERERLRRQLARLDRHLAVLVLRNRRRLRELGRDALSGRRIGVTAPHSSRTGGPGRYAIEPTRPTPYASNVQKGAPEAFSPSHTMQDGGAGRVTLESLGRPDRFGDTLSAPDPRRSAAPPAGPTDWTDSYSSEPLRPVELLGISAGTSPSGAPPKQPFGDQWTDGGIGVPDAFAATNTSDASAAVPGTAASGDAAEQPGPRDGVDAQRAIPQRVPTLSPLPAGFPPPQSAEAASDVPTFSDSLPAEAADGHSPAADDGEASAPPERPRSATENDGTVEPADAAPREPLGRWPTWILNRARQMRPRPFPSRATLPTVEARSVLRPLERPVAELAGLLGARENPDAAHTPSPTPETPSSEGATQPTTTGNDANALLRAWHEALERAEAALRAVPVGTDAAQRRRRIAAEVRLRLLALLANRPDLAMTPIPGLSSAEQEFWQKLLWGTANALAYTAAADQKKAEPELLEAIASFEAAAGLLAEHAPLRLTNVTFCRRIDSYGSYEPFSDTVFRPGQPVLLYAELEHFRSEPTETGMMRSAVKSVIEIRQADGGLVDRIDFPLTEDFCRHRRRDYFLSFQFAMPRSVQTLGPHVLVLSVRDELSGREAMARLRFTLE